MATITHTEVLTLAAKALEAEIAFWEAGPDVRGLEDIVGEYKEKLKAVCELYRIETGTELR